MKNIGNFDMLTYSQALVKGMGGLGCNTHTSCTHVNPEMTRHASEAKDDGMLRQELQHLLHDEWRSSKSNQRNDYNVIDTPYPARQVLQRLGTSRHRHAEVPRRAMYRGTDLPRPMYRVPEYLHEHQAQRRSEYDEYHRQHPYFSPRN